MTPVLASAMPNGPKIRAALLDPAKDYHHRFGDVVFFLERTGWKKRTTGGYHIFTRPGLPVLINLQPEKSGRAKAYQIRQVRTVLITHNL